MTKLEQLIEQLCPDGVEYKEFGEIATISRGASPRPIKAFLTNRENGVHWIKIGDVKTGEKYIESTEEFITVEGAQKSRAVKKGDFILSNSMSFGRPYILKIDGYIHDGWLSISGFEKNLLSDFLYYVLNSTPIQAEMRKRASFGGAVQNLNADIVRGLSLPVPPLEVQVEIVRILDTFTELTTELTTELANRKKQYEYYRDKLLSFTTSIPIKRIGEITKVFSAARVHKGDWTTEGVPFFRSSDVISAFNGEVNPRGKAFISNDLYERLSQKSGRFEKDDILITGGGTIGIPYIIPTDDPLYVKDADLICIKKNDSVRSRFLYHYFLSNVFRKYLKNITHDATIAHYTITQIENTPIPVPSLSMQDRLINVLDNFESICSDLNIGLPAEIDARQKQYEYYRDLLLTFAETGGKLPEKRREEKRREEKRREEKRRELK